MMRLPFQTHRYRGRSGHTLAELMVVLLILVMFALIVGPRVLTALAPQQLDIALNAIRGDLDYARARTTATGMRHQFTVQPDTGEVIVVPVRMHEMTGSQAAGGAPQQDAALTEKLAEEVKVVEWSVTPLATGGMAAAGNTQLTDVLTFYPEGTSDSAQLVLEDSEGNRRGLELNGYTGELRELTQEELPAR